MDAAHPTYRYPGSRPFHDTDLDRKLFWGRARESHALLHLVLAEKLVVLFARSGMGKSSLLNAGVLEPLRERGYLPLTVRVNDPRGPLHSVYRDVEESLHRAGTVLCTVPGGRLESHYELSLEDTLPPRGELAAHCVDRGVPLWLFFKEAEIWRGDRLLEPVLVCDQFEELFTLQPAAKRTPFIEEMAAMVRDRRASQGTPGEELRGPSLKVVLSLREDWLGSLEELASKIPGILATRFRLEPLTREQAREAVERPAALADEEVGSGEFGYAPDAVEAILDFLSQRRRGGRMVPVDEVEPSQLQIVCQYLERLVRKPGHGSLVTLGDLGGQKEKVPRVLSGVLEKYYEEQIARHATWPRRRVLRRLCETGLILDGRRASVDQAILVKSFGVTAEELGRLTDSRLLRAVPRLDTVQYELSHDTLVEPILAVRERRLRRRNRLAVPLVAAALAVTLGGVFNERARMTKELETTEKILGTAWAAGNENTDRVRFLVLATAAFDRTRGHSSEGRDDARSVRQLLEKALEEGRETRRQQHVGEHGGRSELCAIEDCGSVFKETGTREECVAAECFEKDGVRRLAVTDRHFRTRIWDGTSVEQIEEPSSGRLRLAVDPAGEKIVTASNDGTLRLWYVDSGQARPTGPLWPAHPGGRIEMAFSRDGRWLASRGVDRLKVWDVDVKASQAEEPPKEVGACDVLGREAAGVAWSPDGNWIASTASDWDPPLRIWKVKKSEKEWECDPPEGYSLAEGTDDPPFAFDPSSCLSEGDKCILAVGLHGEELARVGLWSLQQPPKELRPFLEVPQEGQEAVRVRALAWRRDGLELAYGGSDDHLRVWKLDAENQRWAGPRKVGSFDGRVLAFHPEADYLAAARGKNLEVWEERGASFVSITGQDGDPLAEDFASNVNFLSFTEKAEMLVASDYRGNVKLLSGDLSRPDEGSLDGSHHFLTAVAFSADGSRLLSWGSDGKVRLREREQGRFEERTRPIEPEGSRGLGTVRVVALGPDGEKFAAADADGTLRVWNDEGELEVGPLRGHQDSVLALEFGSDGKSLESRGSDGTSRSWDVTSPRLDEMDDDALVSLACGRLESHPLYTGTERADPTLKALPEALEQVRRRCPELLGERRMAMSTSASPRL